MNQGLGSIAQDLARYGRGGDTMLAHISPDEAQFIDHLQGGRRTNPHTGLAEYSLFGKILKAVVRAGAAVGGFMIGGPAGAAAGAGLATKLTGGSWKQALGSAALSGIGSLGAQGLSGGGWGLTGGQGISGTGIAGLAGTGTPGVGAAVLNGTALPSVGSQFLEVAKSAPGLAAALPAAMAKTDSVGGGDAPAPATLAPQPSINLNVGPGVRTQVPYAGDYAKYGQPGQGGEHQFFSNVNPPPIYHTPTDLVPQPLPYQPGSYADGGPVGLGAVAQNPLERAALAGWMAAAKGGGVPGRKRSHPSPAATAASINGPGGGKDDLIEARLSANEHVIDSATISDLGDGNPDEGHRKMEQFKQEIRRRAGRKNPRVPTKKQPSMTTLMQGM